MLHTALDQLIGHVCHGICVFDSQYMAIGHVMVPTRSASIVGTCQIY